MKLDATSTVVVCVLAIGALALAGLEWITADKAALKTSVKFKMGLGIAIGFLGLVQPFIQVAQNAKNDAALANSKLELEKLRGETERKILNQKLEIAHLTSDLRFEQNRVRSLSAQIVVEIQRNWPPGLEPYSPEIVSAYPSMLKLLTLFITDQINPAALQLYGTDMYHYWDLPMATNISYVGLAALPSGDHFYGSGFDRLSKVTRAMIFVPLVFGERLPNKTIVINRITINLTVDAQKVATFDYSNPYISLYDAYAKGIYVQIPVRFTKQMWRVARNGLPNLHPQSRGQ